MLRAWVHALIVVLAMVAVPAGSAAAGDGGPAVMPVADVEPGMRGYGLTAFAGAEPERFDVEVLSVIRGTAPKSSIVLIRMSGPVLEEAGIIAGMSGSPVYIDEKLVGAVAYGWQFTSAPLAGVTPAEEMLGVQRLDAGSGRDDAASSRLEAGRAARAGAAHLRDLLLTGERRAEMGEDFARGLFRAVLPPGWAARPGVRQVPGGLLPSAEGGGLIPLPIPLAVGGKGAGWEAVMSALSGGPFLPVQAGAASGYRTGEPELRAGVPCGAVLVSGDMEVTSMGTVTWADGDHVAAFGHPLLNAGSIDLPFALGWADCVVPSLRRSFRLSTAARPIGRIVQDRDPGVIARIGESAATFPCTVRVGGEIADQYEYTIAGHWQVAPALAYLATVYSSAHWQAAETPHTVEARARIKLEGVEEPVVLGNAFTSYAVEQPCAQLVALPLVELLTNPFREVAVESLDYEVEVQPGFEAAWIRSVRADRQRVRPGETVTLYVRLVPWRGEEVALEVGLQIPADAQPGTEVEVLVCDAFTSLIVTASLDPGLFMPASFEGLVEALAYDEPNRNLIVRASLVQQGVRYRGQPMPSLPPSALSLMQSGEPGLVDPLVADIRRAFETPWVLEGAQELSLVVVEADSSES
jgi:hypothetical protein